MVNLPQQATGFRTQLQVEVQSNHRQLPSLLSRWSMVRDLDLEQEEVQSHRSLLDCRLLSLQPLRQPKMMHDSQIDHSLRVRIRRRLLLKVCRFHHLQDLGPHLLPLPHQHLASSLHFQDPMPQFKPPLPMLQSIKISLQASHLLQVPLLQLLRIQSTR